MFVQVVRDRRGATFGGLVDAPLIGRRSMLDELSQIGVLTYPEKTKAGELPGTWSAWPNSDAKDCGVLVV